MSAIKDGIEVAYVHLDGNEYGLREFATIEEACLYAAELRARRMRLPIVYYRADACDVDSNGLDEDEQEALDNAEFCMRCSGVATSCRSFGDAVLCNECDDYISEQARLMDEAKERRRECR